MNFKITLTINVILFCLLGKMLENNDEYSLSLRPWLLRRLKTNTFTCLQWINEEKNIFKIAWADKGKPGWQETLELYQAWAKHKDGDKNNQNFSTLKSRFRDAMRNSNSILEIKEKNVLNQQTGNYKVYKFLTPDEVEEKKKRQKRGRSSDGGSSPDSQGSSEKLTLSQTTSDSQSTMSLESLSPFLDALENSSPSKSQVIDCSMAPPVHSSNDLISVAMDTSDICQLSPVDFALFDPLSNTAPLATINDQDLAPFSIQEAHPEKSSENTTVDVVASQTTDGIEDLQQFFRNKTTEEVLRDLGIDCTRLSQFVVTLEYDNHYICDHLMNAVQDTRFVYDGTVQNNYAINWPATPFPEYDKSNRHVKKVLENITDGVVLKSVPGLFDLEGMRLGKGHIYYTNDDDEFVKMERHKVTSLFSYWNYIEQALHHRCHNRPEMPSCEVVLSFGTCPSNKHSKSIFVKLKIEPVVAASLREKFGLPSDGSSAILCSEDNSFDEMYRNLDEIRNSNKGTSIEEWKKYIC